MKKKGAILIKALISLSLMGYFFSQVGIKKIYWDIRAIPLSLWMGCFLILVGANFFMAFRWRMVVRHLGLKLGRMRCLKLYFLGSFFNNFLPSGVGGDFVKAYYLAKDTDIYDRSFLSIFLDRYIGLHVMLFAAGVLTARLNIKVGGKHLSGYLLVVLLGLVILNLLMLSRYSRQIIDLVEKRIPRIKGKLNTLYEEVGGIIKDGRFLMFFLLLSGGYILSAGIIHHLILSQKITPVGIAHTTTFLILVNCAIFLPISIGGIGVREGLYLYLYSSYGVPSSLILALSSIYFTLILANSFIGFPIFLMERGNIKTGVFPKKGTGASPKTRAGASPGQD